MPSREGFAQENVAKADFSGETTFSQKIFYGGRGVTNVTVEVAPRAAIVVGMEDRAPLSRWHPFILAVSAVAIVILAVGLWS